MGVINSERDLGARQNTPSIKRVGTDGGKSAGFWGKKKEGLLTRIANY